MARHIISQRTYLLVFGGLIGLTALTIWAADPKVPLGKLHAPVALLIAAAKAGLVLLFFMHVLYSSRLTWIVALNGLAWLTILVGLTLSDYLTRTEMRTGIRPSREITKLPD